MKEQSVVFNGENYTDHLIVTTVAKVSLWGRILNLFCPEIVFRHDIYVKDVVMPQHVACADIQSISYWNKIKGWYLYKNGKGGMVSLGDGPATYTTWSPDHKGEDVKLHSGNLKISNEKFWGRLSMCLILLYVTVGGGYEIFMAIKNQHANATFVFSFLSAFIFIGRIFYAVASKAKRTLWADVYGAVVMLLLSILNIIYNRHDFFIF